MILNCVVVDDSSIQRIISAKLVSNHESLNLTGVFSNAIEAKSYMANHTVDLVFLDVEMPVVSGFDFLDGLKIMPQIIFITSKAEYALKAFDYHATDYLQKPIALERFNISVKKALDFHKSKIENLEDGEHLFIKTKLKKLKVYTNMINWIEAFGDYVRVVADDEIYLVLSTMKAFEKDLPGTKFVRVHKSYIVNVEKIIKYNSKYCEIGDSNIPLSRHKKDLLAKILAISA